MAALRPLAALRHTSATFKQGSEGHLSNLGWNVRQDVGGTDVALSNSLVTNNSGNGVLVSKQGTLDLAYCGISGNTVNVRVDHGHLTQANINNQPAGYLSTLPSSTDFLRIDAGSYQYTAGPGGTPIGAKF